MSRETYAKTAAAATQRRGTPIIQLEGTSKVFSTADVDTYALRDVRLDIHDGEYVAISGPSGGGKSTLLSVLGLLEEPTSGEYRFEGRLVSTLDARERARIRNRQIGFIFQA